MKLTPTNDNIRYPNNPLRNKIQLELRKTFGDLPVVDAKKPLLIFPTVDDFRNGKRMDPHNCGFQRAAARQCGSTAALVFNCSAYFDYLGIDGVRRIYRHVPRLAARQAIRSFDQKGPEAVDVKKAFEFGAPAKSQTLAYSKAHGRKLRRGPRRVILDSWMAQRRLQDAKVQLKQAVADHGRQKERLETISKRLSPQAPTVVETKKQIARLDQLVARRRERLGDLNKDVAAKMAKAEKLREKPFKRKRVQVLNLSVRNGTGYMGYAKPQKKEAA